jgi:hypothetical protein
VDVRLLLTAAPHPPARFCHDVLSYPDGSRRAFYKEFRRVVEASDVVIQVRDLTVI